MTWWERLWERWAAAWDQTAEVVSHMVRPIILLVLTGVMCYLAIVVNSEKAQEALLVQFATLVGAYFGERTALKVPGRQDTERG